MGASLDDLRTRQGEIESRLASIDAEFAGQALPDDSKVEWNLLNEELETNAKLIDELEARMARLEEFSKSEKATEKGSIYVNVRKSESDIWDVAAARTLGGTPEGEARILRDNARRAIERAQFPHDRANPEDNQGHIEKMLAKIDNDSGDLARHILNTGNPTYIRGFGKYITGQPRTPEEERVMSLTTNSGGYGVPYVLDPTIVLSSDGAINPFRQISRVEQMLGNTWQGISSAGATASWDAELAEVSDDALTFAQPTISTAMARVFLPFSIEVGEDYPNFQNQLANVIQDSKDVLEATAFATGSSAPFGVVTSATGLVTCASRGSISSTDVYAMEAALGPRFRNRAAWVMNRAIAQKIRQFDTAGGAQLWIQNLQYGLGSAAPTQGNVGYALLGYGAYESSAMSSTLTTGQKVAVLGDFNQFLIADRVGLSVEYIPHVFGLTTAMPRGERGIFAYWRVGSGVLVTNAFRTMLL